MCVANWISYRSESITKKKRWCFVTFFFFSTWRHKTNAVCAGNLKVSGVVSSNGR